MSSESTGAWWSPPMWESARAAYVFDLDHNPAAPAGFNEWLQWVIEAHVARGPQGRSQVGIPPRGVLRADEGLNRHHPLRVEIREAMDAAIVEDRLGGRVLSRSLWLHEAVAVAVATAEQLAGGSLAPLPAGTRLPNRPSKPALLR